MEIDKIYCGDALEVLKTFPDGCVQMCVTSPPYWNLRDYGVDGQLGNEFMPEEYVANLVAVFHETERVLKDDGVLWLVIDDSYAGSGGAGGDYNNGGLRAGQPKYSGTGAAHRKSFRRDRAECSAGRTKSVVGLAPKNLCMIPARVAMALQADGWNLRIDGIWDKPNRMPLNPRDRPERTHEYIFLFSRSNRYFYHLDRNGFDKRSVRAVATKPYSGAHFAAYPPELIRPCILAGSRPGDIVLDPFFGSGTTGEVAQENGRHWLGIELNPKYVELATRRINAAKMPLFTSDATKTGE